MSQPKDEGPEGAEAVEGGHAGEKQRAGFLGFKRDFVPREESGGFWRQLRAPCQPCQLSPWRAALSPLFASPAACRDTCEPLALGR